jgi:hypothetical protein
MTRNRLRHVTLVALLATAMFTLMGKPADAGSSCGCPPYTEMSACYNGADSDHWYCWLGCNGYPEPDRTACQDACDQAWFDCQSACFDCPV